MTVVDVLIFVLIALPLFSVATAVIATRAAVRKPYIPALTERAAAFILKAIASSIVAFLAVNSRLHIVELPRDSGLLGLVVALVLLELPVLVWAYLYWTNRFRE